jgi:hypothetical protein
MAAYDQPLGVLRHISRQLALMGYVRSEDEFSKKWLGMEGWTRMGVAYVPDSAFFQLKVQLA